MNYDEKISEIRSDFFDSYKKVMGRADTTYSVVKAMKDRALEREPENSKSILNEYRTSVLEVETKKTQRIEALKEQYLSNINEAEEYYKNLPEEKPIVKEKVKVVKEAPVVQKKEDFFDSYLVTNGKNCYILIPKGKEASGKVKSHMQGVLGIGSVEGNKFESSEVNSKWGFNVFEVSPCGCKTETLANSLYQKTKDKNIQHPDLKDMGITSRVIRAKNLASILY